MFWVFAYCNKAETHVNRLNGAYIGYFNRNHHDTAQVAISFTDNSYQGHSALSNYPALCRGTFEEEESSITFHDSCTWPANLDHTLILKGTFKLKYNDDGSVRIWRQTAGDLDEYILGKLMRCVGC